MSDLTYHLEREKGNTKNTLALRLVSKAGKPLTKEGLLAQAATSGEKGVLQHLFKLKSLPSTPPGVFSLPADEAFDLLKGLGGTGRVFYQDQKVFIDPFTTYEIYFEGERPAPGKADIRGRWKLGAQSGDLQACEWVFSGDPSWILDRGTLRPIHDSIGAKWVRLASLGPQALEGKALAEFLEDADGEIPIVWKGELMATAPDPLPFLTLTDRHGGFADLGFDYGSYGKVFAHDPVFAPWRSKEGERGWEKDLLETDFIKKIVENSQYYCPLDKVAKSLTFLLEIGWTIVDAQGRKVIRQRQVDVDADVAEKTLLVRGKAHYDEHQVDLSHLVGAFNRREHFVQLSPSAVALIDRDAFHQTWGDLVEQEVTSEGILLKKNQFGLLEAFLDKKGLAVHEDLREKIARLASPSLEEIPEVGKDFQGTLFSYQKEGLKWLNFLKQGGFGGLLADEMGLGKTVQVLAFFSQLAIDGPLLIVVPTSLIFNWQREIEKFLPSLSVYRHEGKERLRSKEELCLKQVILTSYALLRIDAELLQSVSFQMVVLDEAQAIKNADSQISQVCCRLRADLRLAITGTPIENRLEDLWSIFQFLQPDLLGDRGQFQAQVAAAQLNAQYFERMKKQVRPFILRRKKAQVSLQLPPKIEQTIYVEMGPEQSAIYDRWLQKTRQGLLRKVTLDGAASHRMEILEAILRLRQLCAHPHLVEAKQEGEDTLLLSAKFERLLSDLQEVVEEKQKVLVYSQFTTMLGLMEGAIKEKGWKYVYLDGSTKNREERVRTFQEDPEVSIFLISLKAGGVGLNLTAADYVFLYDPWWNEAVERQAIDRAHRLGKVGTVIARRYVMALSIEEKIMQLKKHKTALSEQLLESEEGFSGVSLDDLLSLLQ